MSNKSVLSVQNMVLIAVFTAIIAVCSWISVPIGPVPFTLQTFAVFVTAGLLGTKRSEISIIVFIILGTICAIAVAILLCEVKSKLTRKISQTCILIPYLVSVVIVSYLVFAFLSEGNGFINMSVLQKLGLDKISWYNEPKYWPFILVIVNLWKNIGYNTIMYYAMIIAIDKTYYEAARVDGATRWQQIINITLPSIKPTIIILTLMSVGRIMYSDFGLFYQIPMNSGTLIDVTNTIDTYVYRGLMQTNNIGMSAAAGVYQSVVGFILVIVANLIVKKIEPESALF